MKFVIVAFPECLFVFVLGFNARSTLVGHFVSSPKKMSKVIEEIVEMKEMDRIFTYIFVF